MKKILIVAGFLFVVSSVSARGFIENAQGKQKNQNHPKPEEVMNRLDANKDGKISNEEAKGPIKGNFAKVDANSDGFITLEELKNELAGNKRTNKEEILNRLDGNKDSKISLEEAKGPLKEHFAKVDANGDGYISQDELQNTPKPARKKHQKGRGHQ